MEQCPSVPFTALVDTSDEEPRTRFTAEDGALPDQARPVVEIRAPTAILPVVEEPSWTTAKMKPRCKSASIDEIVMMLEQLLESTCKWKEEHDEEREARNRQNG